MTTLPSLEVPWITKSPVSLISRRLGLYRLGVARPESTELSTAELRAVQLAVLAEFDRRCRAHGLTYYLAYGTLLGAVRHAGYIPWDDDIDVMMPRAEYERLHDVFAAAHTSSHVSLDSPRTRPDWPFPYAKVSDDRTELFEPLADPLPLGVNLDVFPLDTLPSNRLSRNLQARVLRLLRWAIELRYIAAARGRGWHHPLAIAVGKPLLRLVPARVLVAACTRAARIGSTSRGGWMGVRVASFDWSVPARHLGTPTELSFEGLRLLAPAEPDAVLTAVYGDYRQLPPELERTSHHAFTAVWRVDPDDSPAAPRS
jgi:lipopolysaccharide cholinephosphotransferase